MSSMTSPSLRIAALLLAVLPAVACSVDEAKPELNDPPRWFWLNFDKATPAEVADQVFKFNEQTKYDVSVDDSIKVSLKTRLVAEDLAEVGLQGKTDPSKARGSMAVTIIKCPLSKIEPLLYDLDQPKLYPDTYKTYSRVYTSDLEKYKSRQNPTISWTVDVKASHAGTDVTEHLTGGLRWAGKVDGNVFGPILLARTALMEPAKTDDSDAYFRQDYQAEVYYERAPGETVHMFAVWREAKFLGFDSEGDTLVSTQLDAFVDSDKDLEKLCQK